MRDGGGLYYYHNDHLGTPQRLSDATTGTIAWSAGYAAFGKATIDPLSTVENNLRFPEQYFDAETGLHFNFNRYYEPETGRYFSTDPYGDGLNLYAYGYGNPVNLYDPLGLFSICDAHNLLDLAGMIPGLGEVFDLANGALYFFRGEYGMAALSAGAAIPFAGYLFNAAKYSGTLGKVAKLFRKIDKAKQVPNPGGRLGKQSTRDHIDDVATEMEKRGWTITGGGTRGPEEYLPGPGGGRKGSSFPDITATKNGKTLRVNTVDTRADGVTPSTREATNAARIRSQTPGDHLLLIPKP
jgi:RHS repeat-associated protein